MSYVDRRKFAILLSSLLLFCSLATYAPVNLLITRHAHAVAYPGPQLSSLQAQSPAAEITTLPFAPITLADMGPISTNNSGIMWADVSGDWLVYIVGGAHSPSASSLVGAFYVQNALTHKVAMIRVSQVASVTGGSDHSGERGVVNLHFEGERLVWEQPTQSEVAMGTEYRPGDFDCTRCYYDPATGQGGNRPQGPSPTPTPDATDWEALGILGDYNEEGYADPYTIKVIQKSTNRVVIEAKLPRYENAKPVLGDRFPDASHMQDLKVTDDKLIFVQEQFGHLSPSKLQLVWLVPPDPAFDQQWARSDRQVAAGTASRSWLWGPGPTGIVREPYAEAEGGARVVEYYDKGRMEANDSTRDRADPYYVTNGLLVTEMVSGQFQVGSMATISASVPCTIPIAGDPRKDNPLTPSYSALTGVASLHGDHQAPNRTGQQVSELLDVNGNVGKVQSHSRLARYAAFAQETGHNIPDVFLTYLSGMKSAYGAEWTYILGYPITEAYWTMMRVNGKDYAVLVQAYQRRVLTYTPDLPAAWRVQQGNAGQHYFEWRYKLNTFKPFKGPF
ncbi:MAG TPA: hypothetical protein VEX13_02710 [Chloroflexia bacterium]|nr:hypothetical protein [Chloroflexia bacterium]